MNYRHIFHAGNICDVVKHAVLTLMIGHLRAKDKGFCLLDTHAGTGLYDLCDPRALKTGEGQNGIIRLLAAAALPELTDYYRIVAELNPEGQAGLAQLRFYPGSPVIARRMLRPQDRLVLCELHDEDATELRQQFRNDKQVQIHCRDGYEALGAFLPPAEKRGLALIDPPFEDADEFARLAESIAKTQARWPQGMMMAWYPVKERPAVWRFHDALIKATLPDLLCAEFIFEEETRHDCLNGCGLILVNPPWQLDEKLWRLLPALHEAMQTNHRGVMVKGLVEE